MGRWNARHRAGSATSPAGVERGVSSWDLDETGGFVEITALTHGLTGDDWGLYLMQWVDSEWVVVQEWEDIDPSAGEVNVVSEVAANGDFKAILFKDPDSYESSTFSLP